MPLEKTTTKKKKHEVRQDNLCSRDDSLVQDWPGSHYSWQGLQGHGKGGGSDGTPVLVEEERP